MTVTFPMLIRLIGVTIRTPREAARTVMAVNLPRMSRWEALFGLVLLGTVLAVGITYLFTGNAVFYLGVQPATPMTAAIVSLSASILTVFAIFWIGRALGGTGDFGDAILLVAWTQFVVIAMQIVQMLTYLLLPGFAVTVDIAASLISIWILTNFIAELHGFRSLGRVFLMMLLSIFGFAFCLSILLAMIGVTVPGVSS